jgi:hypothetical protein
VWHLKVKFGAPLSGQVDLWIHKKRKLENLVDQILEELEKKVANGENKSLLEIEAVILSQENGAIQLDDLSAKIEDSFTRNNKIDVNF